MQRISRQVKKMALVIKQGKDAMKNWDQVIKDALYYLVHKDEYAYFYGAKGIRLTDANMDYLIAAEPNYWKRYSSGQIKAIKDWSRGKIGYDCSGYIGQVTGCRTWSGSIWERCTNKSKNLYSGPAASILWKPGHVALDMGYGYFLHFPSELHSCEIGRISENPDFFQGTGLLSGFINYEGATNR